MSCELLPVNSVPSTLGHWTCRRRKPDLRHPCLLLTVIESELAHEPEVTEAEHAPQIASVILFLLLTVALFIVAVDVITYFDTARFMLATNLRHVIPIFTHPKVCLKARM